jgi:hypothetical protein
VTLTTTTVLTTSAGDGAAVHFPTVFQFLDEDDLVVKVAGVTMAIVTDYTVTGAGEASGGTVSFVTAPPNGNAVTIERVMPFTQPADLSGEGRFFPETHEEAYDRITMLIQQLEARVTALEDVPI